MLSYTEESPDNTVDFYKFSISDSRGHYAEMNGSTENREVTFRDLTAGAVYVVETEAAVIDPRHQEIILSIPITSVYMTGKQGLLLKSLFSKRAGEIFKKFRGRKSISKN